VAKDLREVFHIDWEDSRTGGVEVGGRPSAEPTGRLGMRLCQTIAECLVGTWGGLLSGC